MNATLATTKERVAERLFKCDHTAPDGTSAFMSIGLDGEGFEQCIKCGEIICTVPQDDEDPPGRYGL